MSNHEVIRYYVYINWTNTFAKIHRGNCPHCNEGTGTHGVGSNTANGRWLGAFRWRRAVAEAYLAADARSNRDSWTIGCCRTCLPKGLLENGSELPGAAGSCEAA